MDCLDGIKWNSWSCFQYNGPSTHRDSKAGRAIACYSLWMEPTVAAQSCPLRSRDLKDTQWHYKGMLRKDQLYANVLLHSASNNLERAKYARFIPTETEALQRQVEVTFSADTGHTQSISLACSSIIVHHKEKQKIHSENSEWTNASDRVWWLNLVS